MPRRLKDPHSLLACVTLSSGLALLIYFRRHLCGTLSRIFLRCVEEAIQRLAWQRLPNKIIFLRHGQAEHNLEGAHVLQEDNPDRKPDNLTELTHLGARQAKAAGLRIRKLLGNRGTISVIVSPFERTQQTLYALQSKLGDVRVRCVHVDPRVREQEFGNFQVAADMTRHAQTAHEVGRFYYRRPTGESGADVYDRAASFWDSLLLGAVNLHEIFTPSPPKADDALLVVTHGLTMRLLLMRYFNWSPQTFDAVYNPGNCDMWVLDKDSASRSYYIEPKDCSPPCMPWATRQVRLLRTTSDEMEDWTLVNYLALPQPRTSHAIEALREHLIRGHGHRLDPSKLDTAKEREAFMKETIAKVEAVDVQSVEWIDWWCGRVSEEGVGLRTDNNRTNRNAMRRDWSLDKEDADLVHQFGH